MALIRPDDSELLDLCRRLKELSVELDRQPDWPRRQLDLCAADGVMAWFVEPALGGLGCNGREICEGLQKLGQACLTTTFILTQQIAAYKRIGASANRGLAESVLPAVAKGVRSATVGISHLTTSRRYLSAPVLVATECDGGYTLRGYSPWVTGAGHVHDLVTGAELADGRQVLLFVPFDTPGVTCGAPFELVALSGSCTASVSFHDVYVPASNLLDGPREHVVQVGASGSTGGIQTSMLALALASAAQEYLREESMRRPDLAPVADQFGRDLDDQLRTLRAMADEPNSTTAERLRERCNSLVLRSTQAALSAAKGAGYVRGHPAGRWCKEALFFLVWSCPQSVVDANLCELAGIDSAWQ